MIKQLYPEFVPEKMNSNDQLSWLHIEYSKKMVIAARFRLDSLEEAKELVSDIFTQFCIAEKVFTSQESARRILFKTTMNRCVDRLRHRKTRTDVQNLMVSIENLDEREWVEWKEDEPEPVLQMTEMVEAIHKAVDLLPTRYKEAFKARHFLGLSYEQIATDMKIPVEVARNYVNRALRQIKNAMSQPIWVVLLVRIAFILSLSLVFRKSIVIQHANYNHLNLSHAKNHKGMG